MLNPQHTILQGPEGDTGAGGGSGTGPEGTTGNEAEQVTNAPTQVIKPFDRTEEEIQEALAEYSDEDFEKHYATFIALFLKGLNDQDQTVYSILAQHQQGVIEGFDLDLFVAKVEEGRGGDKSGKKEVDPFVLHVMKEFFGSLKIKSFEEHWDSVLNLLVKTIESYKQITQLKLEININEIDIATNNFRAEAINRTLPELRAGMVSSKVEQVLTDNDKVTPHELEMTTGLLSEEEITRKETENKERKGQIEAVEKDLNEHEFELRKVLGPVVDPVEATKLGLDSISEVQDSVGKK